MGEVPERAAGAVFPRRSGDAGRTLARHIARIGAVFDAAPIGVGMWTVEGELVHANPVLCDLLGRSREALVGESFEAFIDPRHVLTLRHMVDELFEGTRNAFECDVRCMRPDGADLWLRGHVHAVYGPGGAPEYVMSQIFHFRPRPADDPATRSVVADESPVMLWVTDEYGIPRDGNPRSHEFTGASGPLDDLGAVSFERVHPEDYAEHRPGLLDAIAARRPFEFTARSRRYDGQWRWLLHRGRPFVDADGSFAGYAGASLDVTELEQERRDLDGVRRLFETVTEDGPLAVIRTDSVGRVLYANGRWADLLDDPGTRLHGVSWRNVLVPEHADEVIRLGGVAAETGAPYVLRVQANDAVIPPHRSGMEGRYWAELRVAPVFDDDGAHDGFVATIADISAEVAAGTRADQLARVLDAGSDVLIIAERNGAISYVNLATEEALGVRLPDAGAEPAFLLDVLTPDSYELFHELVEPALVESGRWRGELALRDALGREVPVAALVLAERNAGGRIESISVVGRDITDLKDAQWRMRQLATHDYLTGLPNRVLLYERLDQALARHHRLGQSVALLYLDLDRFKPINDELGHHVGDAVLVELADRIHAVVRDTDTAARIGGDEFAVLVEGFDDYELLETIAGRLIEAISAPITVEAGTVSVGVSIGIVAAAGPDADADSLLARADTAMYDAKAAGRGRFVRVHGPDAPAGPPPASVRPTRPPAGRPDPVPPIRVPRHVTGARGPRDRSVDRAPDRAGDRDRAGDDPVDPPGGARP